MNNFFVEIFIYDVKHVLCEFREVCCFNFDYFSNRITWVNNLQSEEDEESNHQTEEAHSFGESETENGVGEELLLQAWVSGVADDKRTEHGTNTGAGSGNANGGGTSTNKFGGGVDISSNWGGSDVSSKAHSEGWGSDKLSGGHFIKFYFTL